MKRIILAVTLMAPLVARASEPATIILPTPVVAAVVQYLSQHPYAEVAQMMAALQGCVSAQVPNAQGVTVSHGECPAVSAALTPKVVPAPAAPSPPSPAAEAP